MGVMGVRVCLCVDTLRVRPVSRTSCASLRRCCERLTNDTQLVDPASVYMLVSKTKPCMPKYSSAGQLAGRNRRRLIKSVVVYVGDSFPSWITVENPELIHAIQSPGPKPLVVTNSGCFY